MSILQKMSMPTPAESSGSHSGVWPSLRELPSWADGCLISILPYSSSSSPNGASTNCYLPGYGPTCICPDPSLCPLKTIAQMCKVGSRMQSQPASPAQGQRQFPPETKLYFVSVDCCSSNLLCSLPHAHRPTLLKLEVSPRDLVN